MSAARPILQLTARVVQLLAEAQAALKGLSPDREEGELADVCTLIAKAEIDLIGWSAKATQAAVAAAAAAPARDRTVHRPSVRDLSLTLCGLKTTGLAYEEDGACPACLEAVKRRRALVETLGGVPASGETLVPALVRYLEGIAALPDQWSVKFALAQWPRLITAERQKPQPREDFDQATAGQVRGLLLTALAEDGVSDAHLSEYSKAWSEGGVNGWARYAELARAA
jgi:hypothetical protein